MSRAPEELAELQRQADALLRKLAAGDREAAETSARDALEVTRVVLAIDGRISAVEVFPHWRRRISSDQLGAAIVEAADEAARRRVEAWAYGVSQADDGGSASPGYAPPSMPGGLTEPGDESAVNFSRGLYHVLTDSFARLDDLAAEAARTATADSASSDAGSRARATFTGDRLTAVDFDEVWLRSADVGQIGGAVTEAVRAAYASRDEAQALRKSWPYDELDRMTADPGQLLANLGLAPRRTRESS